MTDLQLREAVRVIDQSTEEKANDIFNRMQTDLINFEKLLWDFQRLTDVTDEQRREVGKIHNQLTQSVTDMMRKASPKKYQVEE